MGWLAIPSLSDPSHGMNHASREIPSEDEKLVSTKASPTSAGVFKTGDLCGKLSAFARPLMKVFYCSSLIVLLALAAGMSHVSLTSLDGTPAKYVIPASCLCQR